ncbi:MAG: sigma 54-interacting transcriptional regulator [Acidobacteriota bacterium]
MESPDSRTSSPSPLDDGAAAGPLDRSSLAAWLDASPSLTDALRGLGRAARTDVPILILGEPGTGRSTLARAVHRTSPRRDGELVEIDPGVVPATLFESDLFGYRAGAFTGAESHSAGRVERAEGGTLLLDHVEEMPLGAQPKLLRLLAERRYSPLGGRERSADVRFLATGATDLEDRVRRGAFRSDLFYRLEVMAFVVPPLRRRLGDLPAILERLLTDLAERLDRPKPTLTEDAVAWMSEYGWPGNLRQLRNVLERAMVVSGDGPLDPEPPRDAASRPQTLRELEEEHIRRTLAYTRGRQGRAADLLGISRKALWEKRKRYGIP